MSSPARIQVAFFDIGNTLVGSNKKWLPGARETLAELRRKHVRLGLISNTANLTRPEILKLLPKNFDLKLFEPSLVIFSSEVHIEKPDPKIFRLAVKRAKVKPALCLFCTEEPAHVSAAMREGMQAMAVNAPPALAIGELVDALIAKGLLAA